MNPILFHLLFAFLFWLIGGLVWVTLWVDPDCYDQLSLRQKILAGPAVLAIAWYDVRKWKKDPSIVWGIYVDFGDGPRLISQHSVYRNARKTRRRVRLQYNSTPDSGCASVWICPLA